MHEAGCEEVLALLGEGGGDTGSLPHPNLTKEIISGVSLRFPKFLIRIQIFLGFSTDCYGLIRIQEAKNDQNSQNQQRWKSRIRTIRTLKGRMRGFHKGFSKGNLRLS